MIRIPSRLTLFIAVLALGWATAAAQDAYHIPKLDEIRIDASADDWEDTGFSVAVLAGPDGQTQPVSDFDVSFRLGWNAEALYVLAEIVDDIPISASEKRRLEYADCIDFVVGREVGSLIYYQLTMATTPPQDDGDPPHDLRDHRHGHRPGIETAQELTVEAASRWTGTKTIVEVALPWSNLGTQPEVGVACAFQLMANDDDGAEDRGFRVAWYPSNATPRKPDKMFPITLDLHSSRPIELISRRTARLDRWDFEFRGIEPLVGHTLEIETAGHDLIELILQERGGRAVGSATLEPADAISREPLEVFLDGRLVTHHPALPTASMILQKYVDALGGEPALSAIGSRVCSGTIVHDFSRNTPPVKRIPFELSLANPNRFTMSCAEPNAPYREGFDGSLAWKANGQSVNRVHQEELSTLRFILNPQSACHMGDLWPNMIVRDRTQYAGRDVTEIEADFGKGNRHEWTFDEASGLLLKWNHMHLGDYRLVDGVKVPCLIWVNRKGGKTSYVIDSVVDNVDLDPARFALPEELLQ